MTSMSLLKKRKTLNKKLAGYLSLLGSAICFYLATLFLHLGEQVQQGNAFIFVLARLFLGLIIVALLIFLTRGVSFRAQNRFWVLSRAFWNTVALLFFYTSVALGAITEANIFNMTYPVFVALLGPYLIKEKSTFMQNVSVLVATIGVYLIIGFPAISFGFTVNSIGLLSGLTAAIAILSLRKARATDHWLTILFYNFSLGSLAVLLLSIQAGQINISQEILPYLLMSALCGIIGQFGLTFGFRYVSAIEGSVLSSSRIIISVMATSLLGFQGLTVQALFGAVLIFIANILAVKRIEIPLDSTRLTS